MTFGNVLVFYLPFWQCLFYNIAMRLKELRKDIGLTQQEAAVLLNVPFRTYCRYEDEEKYEGSFKYEQMLNVLEDRSSSIVLKLETIERVVSEICSSFEVDACYLFGSYARGKATSSSDVDLMIVSSIEGLRYYGLLNTLETRLKKKVDLLRLEAAVQNVKLISEVLKDGIKIY